MDQLLLFARSTLGHFIQDIGGLVNPATLLDWAIFSPAKRSITDGQFGHGQ